MNEPVALLVKYEGPATDKGIDFAIFGDSFIGFDKLLKNLFRVSKIRGTVEVKTEKIDRGSIDVFLNMYVTIDGQPFDNAKYFFEFLQVAAPEVLKRAHEICSVAKSFDDALNTFFRERPFDAWLISSYLIYLLGKHRGKKLREDPRLPDRVYTNLNNLYDKRRFKKALSPLRESGYEKITVSQQKVTNPGAATITDNDLAAYLPEDDQILPHLRNGDTIVLYAKLVGLSSTRGEVVTLKVANLGKTPTIYHAFPQNGTDTAAFRDYYGQDVVVEAEVLRKGNNLYKKPEFNIMAMERAQTTLDFDRGNDS